MSEIQVVYEKKRGCGYRKPSKNGVGLYLASDGLIAPCGRLPFPLEICPCCGAGIKFSRGFTWILPTKLLSPSLPPLPTCPFHTDRLSCPVCRPRNDRAGLMWVGAKYYSPHSFMAEANKVGISKKVNAIPRDFKIGEHLIYLAHKQAVYDWNDLKSPATPGIFASFKPTRVDVVVGDAENVPDRAMAIKERLGDKANIIVVRPAEVQQGDLF